MNKPSIFIGSIFILCGFANISLSDDADTDLNPTKRIYIANDDHTDFMWTADADTYAQTFIEMLDYHIRLAEDTKDNPSPFRNRFNADGSYWLWNYERMKSPAEFDRLMGHIKAGTISAPLNTVVSCYGGNRPRPCFVDSTTPVG